MALTVRVITPDKTVWDGDVQEVILPSISGQLGILSGHAPLLTALDTGVMRVRPGKDWLNIVVVGGFAEVDANEIKVLVNSAELAENIDKETARQDFDRARTRLDEANKSSDRREQIEAKNDFKRSRARFQAVGGMVAV